jgi:neurotrimin
MAINSPNSSSSDTGKLSFDDDDIHNICLHINLYLFLLNHMKVPNQLVGAPLSTDVTLICNVEASPKAINYWQRENGSKKLNVFHNEFIHNCLFYKGEMIISNDRYLMTETENSMYACTMTLIVKKLQKSDMGGYKCISKNSIGDAEGTIRLYGE